MPPYTGFRNIAHYIKLRLRQNGLNQNSFSEAKHWRRGYIGGVIHGDFIPSPARCQEIAESFGDDPYMVLVLAGHLDPPTDPNERTLREISSLVHALDPKGRRDVLEFIKAM